MNMLQEKTYFRKKSISQRLTIQRILWPHQGLVGLEVGRLDMEGTLFWPASNDDSTGQFNGELTSMKTFKSFGEMA